MFYIIQIYVPPLSNVQLPLENLTFEGKTFSTEGVTQTPGGITNATAALGVPTLSASVVLSSSLFSSIAANPNTTDVGIFFSIYKTASFFPLTNVSNSTIVAPLVIGVTVVGVMTNNLTDPIVLSFTIPNKVKDTRVIMTAHNVMFYIMVHRTIQTTYVRAGIFMQQVWKMCIRSEMLW